MLNQSPKLNVVSFETINSCNRDCWFCKFGQKNNPKQKSEQLPVELLEKVCNELANNEFSGRISLYGINEPMMDKRIFDLCQIACKICPRSKVTILSNGDLLNRNVCLKFKEINVFVGVSVYDDKTMFKILDLNKEFNIKIIDRRSNGFIANRAGNIKELTVIQKPTEYHKINKINELPLVNLNPMIDRNCLRPSTLLQIVPNGNVVLCCCDFYEEVVIGNVNIQTVEEIWYGELISSIRKKLKLGRHNLKLCKDCDHNGEGHEIIFP